jgi:hypothetical protein
MRSVKPSSKNSYDITVAARLWQESEILTGLAAAPQP